MAQLHVRLALDDDAAPVLGQRLDVDADDPRQALQCQPDLVLLGDHQHLQSLAVLHHPAQPLGGVGSHDAAFVDDQDAVAGGLDLGEDVGREDHGVLLAQLADQRPSLTPLPRVEALGGLVEDHHVGFVDHRLGDADPLPEALGELADDAIGDVGEVGLLDRQADLVGPALAIDAPQPGDELEVIVDRELAVELHRLGQVADVAAGVDRLFVDVETGDAGRAAGRRKVAGEDPHGGGFTGAVGAKEAQDFSFLDGEADIFEDQPTGIVLRQRVDLYHERANYATAPLKDLLEPDKLTGWHRGTRKSSRW